MAEQRTPTFYKCKPPEMGAYKERGLKVVRMERVLLCGMYEKILISIDMRDTSQGGKLPTKNIK